jgi:ubiquitin-conjugating enzyme E2 D/E
MAAQKRLMKEYEKLSLEPPENISVSIADDIFHWKAIIIGPLSTPYEGGIFGVEMSFPSDYPFRPPEVRFLTRIFHPNINQKGEVCLDILKDRWSSSQTVRTLLLSISSLLDSPNPDDPLVAEIANLYKSQPSKFQKIAKEWTRDYAV